MGLAELERRACRRPAADPALTICLCAVTEERAGLDCLLDFSPQACGEEQSAVALLAFAYLVVQKLHAVAEITPFLSVHFLQEVTFHTVSQFAVEVPLKLASA